MALEEQKALNGSDNIISLDTRRRALSQEPSFDLDLDLDCLDALDANHRDRAILALKDILDALSSVVSHDEPKGRFLVLQIEMAASNVERAADALLGSHTD